MLKVTKANSMGDYPSGENEEDLLDSAFEYGSKKMAQTDATSTDNAAEDAPTDNAAEDADEHDDDARDVAGADVGAPTVDVVAGGDSNTGRLGSKLCSGWVFYCLAGPSASASNRSILLCTVELLGSRKQQRKEAKKREDNAREGGFLRGQSAGEMQFRASITQIDEAAKMKDKSVSLLALSSRSHLVQKEMEMSLQVMANDNFPEDLRTDARKKFEKSYIEAEEIKKQLSEIHNNKRKVPDSVSAYLAFKKPSCESPALSGASSSSSSSTSIDLSNSE